MILSRQALMLKIFLTPIIRPSKLLMKMVARKYLKKKKLKPKRKMLNL